MTTAERALLLEVASYIAQLEEGLAKDLATTSKRAVTLRKLMAAISTEQADEPSE